MKVPESLKLFATLRFPYLYLAFVMFVMFSNGYSFSPRPWSLANIFFLLIGLFILSQLFLKMRLADLVLGVLGLIGSFYMLLAFLSDVFKVGQVDMQLLKFCLFGLGFATFNFFSSAMVLVKGLKPKS